VTGSAELKKAKRALRRQVLEIRDAMTPAERERGSRAIAERFVALPEVAAASTVMAFWSFGSEVDTGPLLGRLADRGTALVLPRIEDGRLEPRSWAPGEPLETTWFGASEPTDGAPVDPATIDVVAVPGVAFDRAGGRLGYGGGFYDGFLPRLRPDALRAAIGFRCQLVFGSVPVASFDLPIDVLVTEDELVRVPPGRR
jgi:5-formyltetrahydrofolate cyclo-ligase